MRYDSMQYGVLDWILEQKKKMLGKNQGKQEKYGVERYEPYQYWFIRCDKCTLEMEDVRKLGVEYGVWELCTVFATFLKI